MLKTILYNILKFRAYLFGLLEKDACDSMVLKMEQLFVLCPWMTWIMICGLLGNSKIHSITKIRGHPFMASTKSDQFFETLPWLSAKITIHQLFKNNRICKHMTNFTNLPSTYSVVIINV